MSMREESPRQERYRIGRRTSALAVLSLINSRLGQDFHTLRTSQVESLLEEADRVHYRKPKDANGSRARYFFQKIQKEAAR